jgi:acetyl esterase/lipase
VHGGAWVTGDRRASVQPLFAPLAASGFAWFSISYRLANMLDSSALSAALTSAMQISGSIEDVRQAVAFVKAHAGEYHVDPARIALMGESAGAQLASMAALRPAANGSVQAVVAFYSPSVLVRLVQSPGPVPEPVRQALHGSPIEALLMDGFRALSPVNWIRADSPPFLLIHGTGDRMVPFVQSEAMCEAMKKAGASCELYPVASAGHGLRFWESNASAVAYKQSMVRWLNEKLGMHVAARAESGH